MINFPVIESLYSAFMVGIIMATPILTSSLYSQIIFYHPFQNAKKDMKIAGLVLLTLLLYFIIPATTILFTKTSSFHLLSLMVNGIFFLFLFAKALQNIEDKS